MEFLIQLLIAVNVMLATALFVVEIGLRDQRYTRRIREAREYKARFRRRD